MVVMRRLRIAAVGGEARGAPPPSGAVFLTACPARWRGLLADFILLVSNSDPEKKSAIASPENSISCQALNDGQKEVAVPAKSAAQQKSAGAALSAKRGDTPQNELKGASKQMERSMSEKQLEEFARTKRKGKPEHVAR